MAQGYRIGEAAEMLKVRIETLRRWEREGKLSTTRTSGGQRLVAPEEVARLLGERRERPRVTAGSVRNRFPGVVTEIKRDKVAATVEILAGPYRVLRSSHARRSTRWVSNPGCMRSPPSRRPT